MTNKNYELALAEAQKDGYDVALVLKLLNQAIEEDSSDAMYALATWYLHGTNVKRSYKKAVALLKKAAENYHASALYDLAVCYEKGKGVSASDKKAFRLYLKASLYGDEQSYYEVGRCYYYGIGVKKDRKIADIWLEKAESLDVD